MSKTIKELSDELGLSRHRIYQIISNLSPKERPKKNKSGYVIETHDVENIKKYINDKHVEDTKEGNDNSNYYLDILRDQLIAKDKQILELQDLLKKQQDIIDQQQKLFLMEYKRTDQLLEDKNLKKRNILNRFFKKNNKE